MIEWGTLTHDALIGQRPAEERHEIVNLLFREIQLADFEVDVL